MPSKEEMEYKISLKENNAVSFVTKDNANTFCNFFSNLADLLLQNFHVQKINLESKLLKNIISIFEMNVKELRCYQGLWNRWCSSNRYLSGYHYKPVDKT